MSSYPPPFPTYPILTPQTFNNDFFTNTEQGLSLDNAYKYFLRLTGGTISGNLNVLLDFNNSGNTYLNNLYLDNILVNSTANELNYNAGITLGIGSASKVLTLNALSNVEGINILEANELTALSGLSVEGGHLTMSASSHIKINSTSDYTNTTDASIYSKGGIYIEKSFQALQNVISNGLLTNSITLNGTAITATATQINYLSGITLGTITASKVLTVDANSNINSILRLTKSANNAQMVFTNGTSTANVYHFNNSDFYFGTTSANNLVFQTNGTGRVSINSAGVLNIQAGWAISGSTVSASATELNYNDITTIGTAEASKSMVLDASKQIKEITKLQIGTNTTLGGRDLMILNSGANAGFRVGSNETTGNCLTFQWTYIGSNNANNKFSIDFFGVSNQFAMLRSGNVGIGTGTPAYTLDVNGSSNSTSLYLNGSQITATATELNYLDFSPSYVLGVCEASKAVVLNSSRNCSNINSITSDFLVVNTSINSSNASASFRKLNLQSIANNFGVISVQGGNNSSPFFGSTDSILYCESSNLSPICFELNVSNLTSATSTNSLRFGTTTANDMNLFTNQIERLNIASTGAVKILSTTQTSSPTTGALLVDGGIGCNKAIWANNNIISNGRLKTLNAGIGLEHTDNTIGLISYVNIADLVFNQGAYFGTSTNHNLIFQTNELERMRINAGGNVSIGNTNNTYKLDITGDVNCSGSFRVNGTALPTTGDLSKISGITNGVVSANKAVVVDGNKDITGFNKITTAELVVSDMIADGTTNINVDGNMIVDGDLTLDVGNLNVKRNILGTAGNCTIERNFTCSGDEFRLTPDGFTLEWGSSIRTLTPPFHYAIGTINNNGWLLMANDNSNGIWLDSSGDVGINTKSPSYQLDVDGSFNSSVLYLDGDIVNATATELNYLAGITLGTITPSKVLSVDSSSNINSILKLKKTASGQQLYFENGTSTGTVYHTLNGDLNVGTISANDLVFQTNNTNRITITSAGLMNILGGWQISGSTVSASATELNYLDFSGSYVLGVNEASKAVVLDSSRNTSNINNITMTGSITMSGINRFLLMRNSGLTNGQNVNFVLGRTNATNEQGEITFTYSTTANASYLSLGHFGSPTILNVFQSGNVSIGNTSNAYKLDINGSLNATSLYLNGSQILATASELNVLDGYTGTTAELNYLDLSVSIGNGEASKALILDTNKDIVGIRKLGLTGSDDFITLTNNGATTTRTTIKFVGDTTSWECGSRNSTNASYPNNFYIYGNGGFRFAIDPSGNIDIVNHNGSTTGLELGGVLITASATELNYVDVVAGAGTASKALVLDTNRDINNIRRISTANISLNNATTYPTPLHCGSTAGNKIIGVFNNTTTFYGFGAQDNQLKLQTGGSSGFGFYTSSTGTNLGNEQMRITATSTSILQTTASTSSTTGALIVSGGIGCAGDIRLGAGKRVWLNSDFGFTQKYTTGGTAEIYSYTNGVDTNMFGTYTNNDFSIATNATARFTISKTGAITTPLNISGNNDMITLTNSTTAGRSTIKFDGDARDYEIGTRNSTASFPNSVYIWDNTNSAYRLVITQDPKLLYNTSSAYSNARITMNGSVAFVGSSDWTDGSYQVVQSLRTSDSLNEIQAQILSGGTAYWGTKTQNKFALMSYNTEALVVDTNQRVGIGTASPSTILHVSGSVSSTVSTGQHGFLNTGGAGWDLNPITFNNSLRTSSSIYCGGTVYAFSDRRIKKDIEIIPDDYSDKFFEDITLIKHRYIHEEDTSNKYLGVIAQEVLKNGYIELIAMHPNENMKKENDDDIEGFTMNVDYAKIALLCVQQIKKLKKELKEIKDFISTLDIQEV